MRAAWQMAVVGLTSRLDAVELLEKRVRSRFSQRILPVPSLQDMADCQAALIASISLAPRAPLASRSADEEGEEERAARPDTGEAAVRANQHAAAVEAAREAGELDEYARAWAAQAVRVGEAAAGSALLRRRLQGGMTPKQLELAVRLALCEVTTTRPLPCLAAIERGLRQQTLPGAAELLRQLSVVELLLLLSLKRLGDREAPPP